MKKINTFFRGTILLFFLISMSSYSQECEFSLEMNDSFGDGWNGANMSLQVNGNTVLSDVTVETGSSTTLSFDVNSGDTITTVYGDVGDYPLETSYNILDNLGNVVASGDDSNVTLTAACVSATDYCLRDPGRPTDGQGITNLELGTNNFDLSATDDAYYDLTGTTVDYQAGLEGNVLITFQTGSFEYSVDIWIDINNDFTFDSSEKFYSGAVPDGNGNGTFNASFIMPNNLGQYRMRIGSGDAPTYYDRSPCYDGSWAVFVDSTVNIIEPVCQPATIGDSTVQEDCNPNNPVFYVNVDVQAGGDATSITDGVTNFPIVQTGVNQVGPFPSGQTVSLTVVHLDNPECDINLGEFVFNCPPINDVCDRAIVTQCGETETGSTEFANSELLADCDGLAIDTAPGVWYSLVGTGGDIVLDLSGSDFDTKLAVFSGNCNGLVCVASDDDGGTGLDSRLTLESTMGTTYYVYINGFGSAAGDYTLSIDCICDAYIEQGECVKLFTGYEPTSSIDLTAVGQFGLEPYTYEWSDGQTTATATVAPTTQTIYNVTVTDAAGCSQLLSVTVLVQDISCQDNGNNNNAKVNICHDGSPLCVSVNAVQAHLNHGDVLGACDDLVDCNTIPLCDARLKVPAPMATDVSTSIEISWGGATGYVTGYLLSVGTTDGGTDILDNEDVGFALDYDLTGLLDFTTRYYVTIVPYNPIGVGEACESSYFDTEAGPWCDAPLLTCDSVTEGNTNDGEVNSYLTSCGGSSFTTISDAPGVWYSFVGTGLEVTVSLCNGTNFDTVMGIYQSNEGCSALTCIDVDDDECFFFGPSESTILTTEGETYYVFVTPFSNTTANSGPFTLTISCATPPEPIAACENALSLECNVPVSGNTTNEGIYDLGVCSTNLDTGAPGMFYKIEGTGGLMTASTCNAAGFDTKLGIFTSEDCATFTCIAGNDDFTGCLGFTSQVSWFSESQTTYFVYVTGFSAAQFGAFDLTVSCDTSGPCTDNDVNFNITLDNFPEETSWEVEDDFGQVVASGGTYGDIPDGSTFTESICLENGCYTFTIFDSFGDGICCSFGEGSYSLTGPEGIIISSNGNFGSSESTSFCLSSARTSTDIIADWSLYPNPSSNGEVELNLSNFLNQDVSIQMTDFSGKVLVNKDEPNLQNPRYRLSTSGMSYGMYFVRVVTESGVSTKKLMIANN